MIRPNWNVFKAKFNENPQLNFEWFCYLLFCKEYNKATGVFRYKDQPIIETDPIRYEDEIIGWQAKFFTKTLSSHTRDIQKILQKTNTDYPDISKLIFYTNQEWAKNNKGNEPKGKQEIEERAKTLGIELIWRTASFFESPFVSIENEIIAKHFFNLSNSLFDLISSQQVHTENILSEIETVILFNSEEIKLDRTKDIEKIKSSPKQILILSGLGGVGKTAIIKEIYKQIKTEQPFYIFKANEFDLRNLSDFFTGYNLNDFFIGHKGYKNKTIVIDSAEKLLDLRNTNPFKEFLSILIEDKWRIIFTSRDNYLEDLNYQFFEIYNLIPLNISIKNLENEELDKISKKFKFSLPKDEKLLELIKNPFYLSEYLKFYKEVEQIDYKDFKEKLWNKVITKSKPAREKCFLQTALLRANNGQFYVTPNCESSILDQELCKDGILNYESPHGYFITHDIYEEWALEKIIEIEFCKKSDNKTFLDNIGNSLPIRRAFRKWVSEKLLLDDNEIKIFIEQTILETDIESIWKDEILVSILLSDYSAIFFNNFKDSLLRNNQELLRRLTFLLRLACKEVDSDFFDRLGVKELNLFTLKYVFTKPKGEGWKSVIKFVFENLDSIGVENINFILPIIYDWSNKIREGTSTRCSGLIALKYYEWIIKKDVYFSRDETKDHLLQTILNSSVEIKNELELVLNDIIQNGWKEHGDPYYSLSKMILTKLEGISIAKVLPSSVLKLAELFWTRSENEDDFYSGSRMGVEQYFGIEDDHLDYFPASAYQTPIYWLLQHSLRETIDFILNFTNKSIETYANSELAENEVEEIDVYITRDKHIKQYISNRIWCTYRGTQVSPHVLESMHMALEKFFLENGEPVDSKTLENWLFYLLKQSKSASISAIVASIVMAYPEKTFNVASLLFRTKEFFFYDTSRYVLDQSHKSGLLMLKNFGNIPENKMFEEERIKACDDKHRNWTLENQFLKYQLFRSESTNEKLAEERQKILWSILDDYYKELSEKSDTIKSEKTWRLYLARMDRRKMDISTEQTEEGVQIKFNPHLEPELKEYSDKSVKKSSDAMKFTPLKIWANYRMTNDDRYKQYKQYEDNPKIALEEAKKVISVLKKTKTIDPFDLHYSDEETFHLFNNSIPADVCSVLIRDFYDKLSAKEIKYCIDIILEIASSTLNEDYNYNITDGVQSVISVLPIVKEKFQDKKDIIKQILLLNLFKESSIDTAGTSANVISIGAIQKIWDTDFDYAHSILIGYLYFKPKYNTLREEIRRDNYQKHIYNFEANEVMTKFLKQYENDFQKLYKNQLLLEDAEDIKQIELPILKVAFQLIPLTVERSEHKIIVKEIISSFVENLFSDSKEDRYDYMVRHGFLEKLAYVLLSSSKDDIKNFLEPLINKFSSSEIISDFFKEVIIAEDHLNSYENFWEVWQLFKEKIVQLCEKGDRYWNVEKILRSYLLAENQWKETASDWHTLKDENKTFFREISERIGQCPTTLYAISKLLYGIGSSYLNDGIYWISKILQNNQNLKDAKLETNTIYYLENLARKYTYNNRERIKRTIQLKQNVLVILDFLIQKGSVVGYMLRENIV